MAVTLLDAVARLRRRIDDMGGDLSAPPSGYSYYWQYDDTTCGFKNPELVQLLDEAQIEFCRREPIRDSTSALTRIAVEAGVARYKYSASILTIDRAYLIASDYVLDKTFHHRVDDEDERLVLGDGTRYYRVDVDERALTLIETPTVAETLQLSVSRLPSITLDWSDPTMTFEVPDVHIEDLLLYAAYLAYSVRDFDNFNPELANVSAERFRSRVGDPRTPRDLRVARDVADAPLRVRAHF